MDNLPKISPKYQMGIVDKINNKLFELYISYKEVNFYIQKWHKIYDCFGDYENFHIYYNDNKINVKETLHSMDGDILLRIAIDLGIETPDFIPCIPQYKNELKSSYETASSTFEKAFKNVESDPDLAIGLANSALESVIKEILKDERLNIQQSFDKFTLTKLVEQICKSFMSSDKEFVNENKSLMSSLTNAARAIEDIRSRKTNVHGKTDDDYVISDSIYACLIVNASATIGIFFLNYYKKHYPTIQDNEIDDLPF